jgi:hypothetical protein
LTLGARWHDSVMADSRSSLSLPQKMRIWLSGLPQGTTGAVAWLAVLPLVALPWPPHGGGAIRWAVLPGVLIAVVLQARGQRLDLSRSQRRGAVRAALTGESSGDPDADAHAMYRLAGAARVNGTANRAALLVVGAVAVGLPVIAAAVSSRWWLLCALPGAVAALAIASEWSVDAHGNLEALIAAQPLQA